MSGATPNNGGFANDPSRFPVGGTSYYQATLGYASTGTVYNQQEAARVDETESAESGGAFGGLFRNIGDQLEDAIPTYLQAYIADKFPEQSDVLRTPGEVRNPAVDALTGNVKGSIPTHYVLIGVAIVAVGFLALNR